jgi:exodeoxyribonuclease V alpha subunit
MRMLFEYLDQARVLTLLRDGPFGAAGINAFLQQFLCPLLDPGGKAALFGGMPLMITANDYRHRVFNGEVGVVVHIGESYYAAFRRMGGFELLSCSALPYSEPAFAVTVHKAQGAENDNVLIVVPPAENQLMTRELLYTALTRARYFVGVFGTELMLRRCIEQEVQRKSGIGPLLQAGLRQDRR